MSGHYPDGCQGVPDWPSVEDYDDVEACRELDKAGRYAKAYGRLDAAVEASLGILRTGTLLESYLYLTDARAAARKILEGG